MRWRLRAKLSASLVILFAFGGCTAPNAEITPIVPIGSTYVDDQNPVYIPLGRELYGQVFENCLQVLSDYGFTIDEANRYDGRIETRPRCCPGILLPLKPGSPNLYERLLSTAQSYRNRVILTIHPADQGGYFISVIVYKDLEDLPRPIKSAIGSAIFRLDTYVDRDFEVVDPSRADPGWISRGRDPALEQEIIRRLKKVM